MTEKEQQSTIQPEQTRNLDGPAEDEMSLTDLLEVLVRKKILILAITTICTLLSIFYVQSATPIYRATIGFLEPRETFVLGFPPEIAADYNIKGVINGGRPSIFVMFLTRLGSYILKNGVFVDGGFQEKFFGDTRINADQAALEIHNSIKIFMPTDSTPQTAHLEMVGPEPEAMAEFLNAIAESAKEDIVKEVRDLIRLLTNAEITRISLKIDNLHLAAKEKRANEIAKKISLFSEALVIAKNLGIKNNNFNKGGTNTRPMWFLYGEKALQQEIIKLKSNLNQQIIKHKLKQPNIEGLAENEIALKQFQAIDIPLIKVNVATISQPSIPPTKSIEPDKIKIIALGMTLGLFISIILAFLINAIEQSRTKNTPSTST